jgi:hypothetical protein
VALGNILAHRIIAFLQINPLLLLEVGDFVCDFMLLPPPLYLLQRSFVLEVERVQLMLAEDGGNRLLQKAYLFDQETDVQLRLHLVN